MRRVLQRCLVKDREQRLRDIGDARFEIEEGAEREVQAGSVNASGGAKVIAPWTVAAVLAIALAVIAIPGAPEPAADAGNVVRFELAVPEGFMRIGTRPASMSLSADGKRLAFIAFNSTNRGALSCVNVLTPSEGHRSSHPRLGRRRGHLTDATS